MSSTLSGLSVGPHRIETPVYLAPMSGVTDLPFRTVAQELGAQAV
ncbi:MAG TPA: tRNA dihydrouridine synthase DusB, partial [Rhodospirillaceae bacterium]|nr:tRNA dihydrouridine synthase DusB [Rhodospirillaceae bacterium]